MTTEDLSIPPDLDPGDNGLIRAAIQYAQHGWYVLPVRTDGDPKRRKQPGSVVGKGWPTKSSRDPQVIADWFTGTTHGIALHCGRSGAVVLDVDDPDKLPEPLRRAIEECQPPRQATRDPDDGHAHYVFRMPPGRNISAPKRELKTGWGEVRGSNFVIIAAPSPHEKAAEGGRYHWTHLGPIPELPDYVADLMNDSGASVDAANDSAVSAFLTQTTEPSHNELIITNRTDEFWRAVERGESRHNTMQAVLVKAMEDTRGGYVNGAEITHSLLRAFVEAATSGDNSRSDAEARSEFRGMLSWAVAKASLSDLNEVHNRVGLEAYLDEIKDGLYREPQLDVRDFWEARPILTHIRDFARARGVAPWAMFGAVLARVACDIPPGYVLPAIIGSPASLNLFVALVGPSGAGKDSSINASLECLNFFPVKETTVGTGQGLGHAYGTFRGREFNQEEIAVLLRISEIGELEANTKLSGSNLIEVLKTMYGGEAYRPAYAQVDKRVELKAHHYRLAIIAGVQPRRAGVLLDREADGTPQRWLWFPTIDPEAPRPEEVSERPQAAWNRPYAPPLQPGQLSPLRVCEEAWKRTREIRYQQLRGQLEDPLAGHLNLIRLKTAALLGALDGRMEINKEDWDLAGIVIAASNRTLAAIREEIDVHIQAVARQQGKREAISQEAKDKELIRRQVESVRKRIKKCASEDWEPRRFFQAKLNSAYRQYLDEVLEELVVDKFLECKIVDDKPCFRKKPSA